MIVSIIFGSLMGISFLAMAGMIWSQAYRSAFSSSNPEISSSVKSGSEVLSDVISSIAHGLVALVRQTLKYLSIHFLVFLHRLASFGRNLLTRIERRFASLIDAVRGRGQHPSDRERGSVSFFLEQIKDYKQEMVRRENTKI